MHNSTSNRAPNAEIRYCDALYGCFSLDFVVFDLFFEKHPHILWWHVIFHQCLFFRQSRVRDREMRSILQAG